MNTPLFTTPQTNPFGLTAVGNFSSPTLVDIDGDGDLDAFVGNRDGNTLFYRNVGSSTNPVFVTPQTNPFGLTDVGYFGSPTFVDIDGDGDFDAFVGNFDGNTLFYRNDGSSTNPVFVTPQTNPFGLTAVWVYSSPTFVDIDGDGDLDAFVGNSNGNTLFYRNDGSSTNPVFVTPQTNPFGLTDVGVYSSPTLVDIDGDGDLDAFVGNGNGNTLFYRNDGSATNPVFVTPQTNPFGLTNVGVYISPTLVDIDGDSDLDAFVGNLYGNTNFYRNISIITNTFFFATPQTNPFNLTNFGLNSSPTLVDIDGDGDLDAFVGNSNGNTLFYRNVGSSTNPSFTTPQTNAFGLTDVGDYSSPTFIDIDGDSDLDAFVGNSNGNTLFYRNVGNRTNASFATPQINAFGLTDVGYFGSPTFVDIDGDGDLDAFVGNFDGNTLFYRNVGNRTNASFATPQINAFGLTDVGNFSTPTFVDIDGDGDLDAFVGNGIGNTLFYRNNGSDTNPFFAAPQINPSGLTDVGNFSNPTFVDIDGDGDLDAFVGNRDGNALFYLNGLPGVTITQSGSSTNISESGLTDTYTVVLDSLPTADVTITLNSGTQLITNVTTLTFTPANWNVAQTITITAVNDTVGEGTHSGVITHTVTSNDPTYNGITIDTFITAIQDNDLTQGNPSFVAPQTNPFGLTDVGLFSNPTFVDIDGDGDLDTLVGDGFGNTLFYRNDGSSTNPVFATPQTNPFGLTDVGSVSSPTFVDIDGDGDLDAFVGNYYGNTLFFRNVGSATNPVFTTPQTNPFGLTNVGYFTSPTFVDIDGDGDLDAFVGNRDGNTLFFRNVGSAINPVFATPQTNPFGLTDVGSVSSPTFVDIDGDGDTDALVGNNNGNTLFYRNVGSSTNPIFAIPQINPFGLTDVGFYSSPSFVDIDGDGDFDALVGNRDGNTLFYRNGNEAPIVNNLIPSQRTENGQAFSYTLPTNIFSDPDGDTLTFSTPGLPGWLSFNANTRTLTGTPSSTGSYAIALQASDSVETVSTTFSINVAPATVNQDLSSSTSDETITAPAGSEAATYKTGSGNDTIDASARTGLVTAYANAASDNIFGGSGNDFLYGGSGNDRLYGNNGVDRLYGEDNDDILYGGAGNDLLYGGNGNDTFYGGLGNDNFWGNVGVDIFVLEPGNQTDTIRDYADGMDKLGLKDGLSFGALSFVQSSANAQIRLTSDNSLLATLINVNISVLEISDFVNL
ncbi:FG-GAP-like repeat-containing protein [Anabaena azotica]|uniref:FG-GAP-like repeat-containing protein n=1 Tax=Anabaena azotica TaxID=197653 RepID=UPI0039A5E622